MSLIEFQRTLLDLYTNKTLLDAFFASPDPFLSQRDLTERERKAILGIPRDVLDRTRKELVSKRYRLARKILPHENRLIVLAFGQSGNPELAWGHPRMRTTPVSPSAFWLLRALALKEERFTPRALISASMDSEERVSFRTVVELAQLMYGRRLVGKLVHVPGVTH
jgi:hypothetical protein